MAGDDRRLRESEHPRLSASAVAEYRVKPLSPATWDAFADLAERHNGVWGECWDTWFHPDYPEKRRSPEGNRALKKRLVEEGKAHAALVFDGDLAVGWCQFGSVEEHDTQGKKVTASFLYNGTRSLFEQAGFAYERPKGMKNTVMKIRIAPARKKKSSRAKSPG